MICYAAMLVWEIHFLYESTAVVIFELRMDFRSRKMTGIPKLLICIMLVKRLLENSDALKGSAYLHLLSPFFNIIFSGFIEDGKCAVCCDCFFQCALPTVHSLVGGVLAGRNYKLCTAALRAPFICKHLLKMIIYLKPTWDLDF